MLQNRSKNKTGAFLGMESMNEEKGATSYLRQQVPKIPPLHMGRGRCMRTPTEAGRHKKVQAIREKESYKGFSGLPLTAAQRPKTSPAICHRIRTAQKRNGGGPTSEDIIQLTRQNPRRFTAVNNHGVTHREYLSFDGGSGEYSPHDVPVDLATALAQTAEMAGPTQYYHTLCGNNPEALKTLLTNKKFGWPTNQYTGFNIRSYKKPPTAQLLANLDSVGVSQYRRPKTAVSTLSSRELLVPQPFIYNRSAAASARRISIVTPRTAAVQSQSEPIAFADDVIDMYSAEKGGTTNSPEPGHTVDPGATEDSPDNSKSTANLIGRFDKAVPIMKKMLETSDQQTNKEAARTDSPSKVPQSTPKINIAIETDEGDLQPPEIDEIEDVFTDDEESKATSPDSEDPPVRRHSITDRIQKIKLGEDAAKSIKFEAEQRKKVLENLLEEHEHLVRQIISADAKENSSVSH